MRQTTIRNTILLKAGGAVTGATDVITTSNKVLINPKAKSGEYTDIGDGKAGGAKGYTVSDFVTADFSLDVTARSTGTAGATPKYAGLFKICGLEEDVEENTSVSYTPSLTGVTGNAKAYTDGELRNVSGISGTFSFSGKVGELAKFSFKLKGFTTLEPSQEANPETELDSNNNLVVSSATAITQNGNALDMESFEFDSGADIQEVYGTQTKEYFIQDFKPTLKIKAIKTKANNEHWSDLKNNSIKEVKIVLGNEDGKKLEFEAKYCNATDVSESDDGGKMVYEKTYLCQKSAGNDNYSLTYK